MQTLLFDVRYAIRLLLRNRGFALMAVLTLAIGIGANSAIFAVVHGVLFRDLPYRHPDRLVEVRRVTGRDGDGNHSAGGFIDLQREVRSLAPVAAYRLDVLDLSGGTGDPERVGAAQVSATFFDVLGVDALAGRTFTARQDDPRGERLLVLSHDLWTRRFAADPAAVGRKIRVNREPCVIVGVVPRSFAFPAGAEAWLLAPGPVPLPPLTVEGDLLSNRDVNYLSVVARLKDGTTIDQANADLAAVAASLAKRYPRNSRGEGLNATPLHEVVTRDARGGLLVLLGAVAFVLLVACANVAGLMLARGTGRRHELALRAALGAGRLRLTRQLLTESLIIGLLGSVAALFVASWGLDLLLALMADLPRQQEIGLDWTVTLFTIALGAGTALLFGLLPALDASRTDVAPALHAEGTRTGARGPGRAMSALVVLEVVSGLVLTVGAGLMVATLQRLQAVDPGYRTEGLIRLGLPLPTTRYGTESQQAEFYGRVLEKLRENQVTRNAAVAFPAPLSGGAAGGVNVEGRPAVTERERPMMSITWVSPGYFKVMGIPLRQGRDFDAHDVKDAPLAAVISRAAAARMWPGEDPIGRRFNFGDETDTTWYSVVGVVGDVRQAGLSSAPEPMVYFPMQQNAVPLMSLLVRTEAGTGTVASAVKSAVRQIDPELPVGDAAEFSTTLRRSLGGQRLRAAALSGFAVAALLLAALGVYGLLSYSVARRGREIGIRLALGATPTDVFRSVIAEGMKPALLGIALGVPASLALTRLIAAQLFGVRPGDPFTLAAVCLLLAAVALAACYFPARRVLAIDPMRALRAE